MKKFNIEKTWLAYLSETLEQKRIRNPSYSLRAFARDLGVEQSLLCKILNGKRGLSTKQACKIALRLNLKPESQLELIFSTLKKR